MTNASVLPPLNVRSYGKRFDENRPGVGAVSKFDDDVLPVTNGSPPALTANAVNVSFPSLPKYVLNTNDPPFGVRRHKNPSFCPPGVR